MNRPLVFIIALGAGTALYAIASNDNPSVESNAEQTVSFVNDQHAAQLVANGILVVDVRSEGEWNNGNIAGALHIPFRSISEQLPLNATPETPVLLYCKSGGRATRAAKAIKALGYQQIFVLKPNGYAELQQALDAHRASQ